MPPLRILTASEQLYKHLRTQILKGIYGNVMPGRDRLAKELRVGRDTLEAALHKLEMEGLLINQGHRRGRLIALPDNLEPPSLRLKILLYEPDDAKGYYRVDLLHKLQGAGHAASFASKTLLDFEHNPKRITRFIEKTPADAWIIFSGPREVLEWFAEQKTPAFAIAGRQRGVPIAGTGPDKVPALRTAISRLIELGHQRIVMIARELRLKPQPGTFEMAFLNELKAQGIPVGKYNLPEWKDTKSGFHQCLESLFQHTPPTALIIGEMPLFVAAQQHLSQRGLLIPRDVSLICDDPDPAFTWCQPTVAHIDWDSNQWANRIVRWANRAARGTNDLKQNFTKARFIEGGTIGPARISK